MRNQAFHFLINELAGIPGPGTSGHAQAASTAVANYVGSLRSLITAIDVKHMVPTKKQNLRSFTGDLLRLARIYRREVNRCLARHGLSDARALPVLQIARSGNGMRQGVLAEELGLEGPSLVRLLDQICAAGLAERRGDPSDGRANTLHLTAAGRELAAVVEKVLHELRIDLLAGVADDDLAATLRTLATFEAALEASTARDRRG